MFVVVGLSAMIVWASNPPSVEQVPVPSSSLPPLVAPATTIPPTTSNVVDRTPLAEFVPSLDGQLVTLQGQRLFLLITRESDQPETLITPLPGGISNVSYDASGDLIAMTMSTAGPDRLLLVDESEVIEPRFLVTSYVWHDTRPVEAAVVIVDEANESWNLNRLIFHQATRRIFGQIHITGLDSFRTVRAWTDTGFVLRGFNDEEATPFVEFIDLTGEVVWQIDGELLDVSPTGDILIGDYVDESWEVRMVHSDDTNGGPGEVLHWAPIGFSAVRWSTSGQMIAFIGYAGPGPVDWGLHVYTSDGALLHTEVIPWRVWDIQWSPDDKYILMPGSKYILMPGSDNQGTHAVIFYNRHTDQLSAVDDFADRVQWSDLRPQPAP